MTEVPGSYQQNRANSASPQRHVCRASRSLFQCEVEPNQHIRRAIRDHEVGALQVSVSTRAALRKE